AFGFGDQQNGLYGLKGSPAVAGTALDDAIFGKLLLPAPNSPRSVDLWPIFNTGVPNLVPYQLATGKNGNPLAAGKPFINNFLPTGGDMLRLNMAVPPTPRNDPNFSALGLVQASVLGLTDSNYNSNTSIQFIPNMDGFPNGRRLEDDVTRIELQAVSGVVLAAIGLWYDDFNGTGSPVTPDLVNVLTYSTGVNHNDTTFKTSFPYVQTPWSGLSACCGLAVNSTPAPTTNTSTTPTDVTKSTELGLSSPAIFLTAYPNPFVDNNTIRYRVESTSAVTIAVYDLKGDLITVLVNQTQEAGVYSVQWIPGKIAKGTYFVRAITNGVARQSISLIKN
ncbi:MAG TPA: DUF4331 family protein, partial [Puia sp.]|nr:DUF4331 family protein [Puia sp.]